MFTDPTHVERRPFVPSGGQSNVAVAVDQAKAAAREADKESIVGYLRRASHDPMITYEEDAENILQLLRR